MYFTPTRSSFINMLMQHMFMRWIFDPQCRKYNILVTHIHNLVFPLASDLSFEVIATSPMMALKKPTHMDKGYRMGYNFIPYSC